MVNALGGASKKASDADHKKRTNLR